MGAHSRSKGKRGEREIVRLALAHGLEAERTWHTAQSPDARERACDVKVAGRPYQVKRQRDGFQTLYDGLEQVAGLFVRGDGREWLALVRAEDLLRLLACAAPLVHACHGGGCGSGAISERSEQRGLLSTRGWEVQDKAQELVFD